MSKLEEKINRQRLRSSYITSVFSITLVLFMLGLLSIILLDAKKLSDVIKENIGISVMIKEGTADSDIILLKKSLDSSPFVKSTKFITQDEAAKIVEQDLGQNFISILGFNPLTSSIDISLKADYANNDSLRILERRIMQNPYVKEVFYQQNVINKVNENFNKITIILSSFSILLLIIAFAFINSTIRLAIFSKRLIIKSMQLVGATSSFIRKPFIKKAIIQGLISGALASLLLLGTLTLAESKLPELKALQDYQLLSIVFAGITVFGLIISLLSTIFAVRKYLRIKSTDIF